MKSKIIFILLCVGVDLFAQSDDSVLMTIGSKSVMCSEFEYAYCKNGVQDKNSFDEFLHSFVNLKLLSLEAADKGLDTLATFRDKMKSFAEQCGRYSTICNENNDRPDSEPFTRLMHLYVYLPQHSSGKSVQDAYNRMDSIYMAVSAGTSFGDVVYMFVNEHPNNLYGEQVTLPVGKLMNQMGYKVKSLKPGELSRPFTTAVGVHLVQLIGREGLSENVELPMSRAHESKDYLLEELKESLLIDALLKEENGKTYDEQLASYFKKHKKQYKWNFPHYKGCVLYCKDKSSAKDLESLLKQLPMGQWKIIVDSYNRKHLDKEVEVEIGLFQIGDNMAVDKVVYKQGVFLPPADYPFVTVIGKNLRKNPESYLDVLPQVEENYRNVRRADELERCRMKYKVEINEEVLKTVNNS